MAEGIAYIDVGALGVVGDIGFCEPMTEPYTCLPPLRCMLALSLHDYFVPPSSLYD